MQLEIENQIQCEFDNIEWCLAYFLKGDHDITDRSERIETTSSVDSGESESNHLSIDENEDGIEP